MRVELETSKTWVPEAMQPGTLFLLQPGDAEGGAANPFTAVLACPSCGTLGLITHAQYGGREPMICGSARCSAEYTLRDDQIRYRRAQ